MSIYDSEAARHEVRDWCTARLAADETVRDRAEMATTLGPTHVTLAGRAGPWVLVLPATAESAAVLGGLTAALAGQHRVAVVDLPGEPGLSHDEPPHDDLIGRYDDWLSEIVSAVAGDEPVVLVADGLGATVALCSTSDRVAGLVAVSPVGVNEYPGDLGYALRELRVGLSPTEANANRLLRPFYGDGLPPDHDLLVEWTMLLGRTVWPSDPPALLPNAVLSHWRDIPHRVLVGEHDAMHRHDRIARPVEALMGSEVRIVPGVGEAAVHEDPGAVAGAVGELTAATRA